MKKLRIILIPCMVALLFGPWDITAQQNREQMAAYYYDHGDFTQAAQLYETLYQQGNNKYYYQRLLNIARKEKAVAEGLMFDLMYVNQQYYRQYAFIRKADRQMLLIVANFDDVPVSMSLTIPSHAFDYLSIAEGTYPCTDLLTGTPTELPLPRDAPVTLHLLPRQSVVLKL